MLGDIPYLNGGLFQKHAIELQAETDGLGINIPDRAFQQLFAFFDKWTWHLHASENATGDEIDPDVLGYIFEKYINQKQMGAYYTKEDITGYIAQNTVIPFLFDTSRKGCANAFQRDGAVWRMLRDDPNRYMYAAMRRGNEVLRSGEPVSHLPCAVAAQLLGTPPEVSFIGDLNLLTRPTTAFFSSSQCPGAAVLRAFERMTQLRDAGEVVIGGFHSPMEQDCLRILLRGRQPIVFVFARALANLHLPPEVVPAYTDGRLLLLSPFGPQHRRVTAALAARRNRFAAAVSTKILVAHATPGGQTALLLKEVVARGNFVETLA